MLKNFKIKKEHVIAIVGIILTLLIVLVVGYFVLTHNNSSKNNYTAEQQEQIEQQKESIKKVYNDAGVDVQESDFEVNKNESGEITVSVVGDKADDGLKASQEALNEIKASITGDYSYTFEDVDISQDEIDESYDKNKPAGAPDKVDLNYIGSEINKRLSRIKIYMDGSTSEDNYPYNESINTMLDEMRKGNGAGEYGHNRGITNGLALRLLCTNAYFSSINDEILEPFNSSWEVSYASKSDVLWNVLLNKYYNSDFSKVDLFIEDKSKSFVLFGRQTSNSYIAISNGHTVYLDATLNVLDII